jgi:hypothetical protein
MIRTENPFNEGFDRSTCFFAMTTSKSEIDSEDNLLKELQRRGGRLNLKDNGELLFEISHRELDGPGGLLCLKSLGLSSILDQGNSVEGFEEREVSDFVFRQFWTKQQIAPGLTERFVRNLISTFPGLESERIGLPVALDNLHDLTINEVWGNSSVLVTPKGRSLLGGGLRKTLLFHADRIYKRRSRLSDRMPNYDTLTVSSLGALDKFPWAPFVTPRNFLMGTTPINDVSANMVLWSADGYQVFSCIFRKEHWVHSQWDRVLGVWKQSISAN